MFGHPKSKKIDHGKLGQQIEDLLFADYVHIIGSTKRQIWGSVLRGFFTGLGGVIGATLGVALLLTILHFLGGAPVIGEYIRGIAESISQGRR